MAGVIGADRPSVAVTGTRLSSTGQPENFEQPGRPSLLLLDCEQAHIEPVDPLAEVHDEAGEADADKNDCD